MKALRESIAGRLLILLVLAAWLSACRTWKAASQPTQALVERAEPPTHIRVTRADDSQWELYNPWIADDTLFGYYSEPEPWANLDALAKIAIPVEDVKTVELRKTDVAGTVLVLAVLGGLTALVAEAVKEEPPPPPKEDLVSCPLVYSFDGEDWRLDSGTFAGAILPGLARTDVDNLEFARTVQGRLMLKLANELAETDYVDAISVLAVDHAPGLQVAPDHSGRLHSYAELVRPARAHDDRGRDALPRVVEADGWNWESAPAVRDTSRAADLLDGLEIVFPRPAEARTAKLLVDGSDSPWAPHLMKTYMALHGQQLSAWHLSMRADPERARRLGAKMAREGFLRVALWTGDDWLPQGIIWGVGPEAPKRQALPLDLTQVPGALVRVRLESIPSLWLIDQVAIDYSDDQPLEVRELYAETAVDASGRDVRAPLSAVDRDHYVLEPGDFAELAFRVPPTQEGAARSYLVRTTGWYRVHAPEIGEPDVATLDWLERQPGSIARFSVILMNEALRTLAQHAPR
ncbi:MAG: hypothetical protein PVJ64_15525 [Gemmatimonadales bacterium]|jgi:hypothetical protein